MKDKSLETICKLFDTLQGRWSSDGRNYGSGSKVCAADFVLLALDCRYWNNPNTKNPEFAATVKAELEKRPAVKGVLDRIKGENGL